MEFIYLIGKELKIQLKQLPIYLYMIIVVAFLFSQITFPDKTTRLEPISVSEYLYEHIYKEYRSEEREVYNVLSLSHVIGDIRSGFLIAIAYYLLEFVTKGSITGLCYLFRPLEQNGNGYEILIFMIIGLLFVGSYKRKEIRGERVS